MWGPLISVVDGIGSYFNNRQTIKAAEKERKDELKRMDLDTKLASIRAGVASDIKQDEESRGIAGVMDDISFYVFLAPLVLCFYPPAVPHIREGFTVIESMPVWWQYGLGMMLVAVWGYRRLVVPIVEAVVKQYVNRIVK